MKKRTKAAIDQLKARKASRKPKDLQQEVDRLRPVVPDDKLQKLLKEAKTGKGKRYLKSLEPQVHEETKPLLLLKGHRINEKCSALLSDLHKYRKPHTNTSMKQLQSRLINAMDDPADFEYLGERNNAPLFAMASSTKKRPLRLFLGRLFNHKLYDLFEFDVVEYLTSTTVKIDKSPLEGSKPLVIFQGGAWESSVDMLAAKNLFADLYGGVKAEKVMLSGFDHVFFITAYDRHNEALNKTYVDIKVDHFHIKLAKDSEGGKLPEPELTNIGPSLTLRLARARLPDSVVMKAALRVPAEEFKKSKKNVSTNDLLETRAKVWTNKEDFTQLHTRHAHPEKYGRRAKKDEEETETIVTEVELSGDESMSE